VIKGKLDDKVVVGDKGLLVISGDKGETGDKTVKPETKVYVVTKD